MYIDLNCDAYVITLSTELTEAKSCFARKWWTLCWFVHLILSTNVWQIVQAQAKYTWWQTSPRTYRVVWLEFFLPKECFFVISCNRKQPTREQRNFFNFLFSGKIRSAWCVFLVKLCFLRLHVQLSSRLETYSLSLVTNVVASEMGRLVLLLLASKSFDSLVSIEYLKGKGFVVTKEKIVDSKRKLFGGSSRTKLFWKVSQNELFPLSDGRRRIDESYSPGNRDNTFGKENVSTKTCIPTLGNIKSNCPGSLISLHLLVLFWKP